MSRVQFSMAVVFGLILCSACNSGQVSLDDLYSQKPLFQRLSLAESGISFCNQVVQTKEMNLFSNQYVLNGGGVAVGDLNNDGLPDLYFTSNQNENKLYLNSGGLKFEDVTKQSGTAGELTWSTGVTIVDINADGFNDIYVCHAGNYLREPEKLVNELFINNGDAELNGGTPTFTESAHEFGLEGIGRTVHATFFDYDNDNDIDIYLLNHPYNFFLPIEMRVEAEKSLPPKDSDQLLRNNGNGHFEDVTVEAGLMNWAFGLSASVGDLNNDGWTDIYVATDYSERDEYLMNNGDGTFTKMVDSAFFHISNFSMGSDIADFNNDLLPDVMTVDMMAEDNRRKKINMSAMKPEVFWDNVAIGRHYQYMQNTLQMSNGNGTYSDVAEMGGLAFTDWSWSCIFSDLDNDGWKDLFVSNGLAMDLRNSDANKKMLGKDILYLREHFEEYLDKMPSEPIDNYAFRNNGDLTFEKVTQDWGLNFKGFSTGAAVADLDRDGDLDIVLNNVNDTSLIFENSGSPNQNYIQIQPVGPKNNQMGIGIKVIVEHDSTRQFQQLNLARGFQSGAEALLHFGLGQSEKASLRIIWPDGKEQQMRYVSSNRIVTVNYKEARTAAAEAIVRKQFLAKVKDNSGIQFTHQETPYDDYELEILLPHKYSQLGPAMSVGDVNDDNLDDVFLGGAAGFSSELYVQKSNGQFVLSKGNPWVEHKESEDVGTLFFDADGDGDLDLYVASGSNEWSRESALYLDRLYKNNEGVFEYDSLALPEIHNSTSCIKANDFDGDGDLDLFVGGRLVPFGYPAAAESILLENLGEQFRDVTDQKAPMLRKLGMVTDAEWLDYDNDGVDDLIIAGEWMPITVLKNESGHFKNQSTLAGTSNHVGWWQSLHKLDIDKDGDLDLVAGNLGLNTKYKASSEEPFEVYYNDFDQNGKGDIVLGYAQQGAVFPVRGKSCSSEQVPLLNKQFHSYEEFGSATIQEVYGGGLENALNYKANWFASSTVTNNGDGTFTIAALPMECQVSVTNGIVSADVDSDGHLDLVLVGNMYQTEVETCRHDASIGQVLLGDGTGNFEFSPWQQSGLSVIGDTKQLEAIRSMDGSQRLLFGINNQTPVMYEVVTGNRVTLQK